MALLNYSVSGTGKNIVLIHGWGLSSAIWKTIANQLSLEFRVTLFDLPGYGDNWSLKPQDEHNLTGICEKIRPIIPKDSIIIGWSMGGLIAMWLAIKHPETTVKLVLTNSTPCFIEKNSWPGIPIEVLKTFKEELMSNPKKTMLRFISLQIDTKNVSNAHKELQLLRSSINTKEKYSKTVLQQGLDILLNTDLRLQLVKIPAPVLWLFGKKDRLVPIGITRHLKTYLCQTRIKTILSAAHIPFISHSNYFIQTIKNFIYDQSA